MDERVAPDRLTVPLPGHERPQQDPAAGDDEEGRREAERLERRVLRLDQTPHGGLQDPEDDQPETGGRQDRTDDVEPRLWSRPDGVTDEPGHDEDPDHEDDLAGEHDPPGEHRRRPAPEDRTDRDAGAGHAPDDRVGDLAVLALEVAGDQRDHRRQDERGADALEDRPAQGEDRHGRGKGGHRRAAPVDDEADTEGPPAPDDVADLAARQHEHRHDEAVERDDRLDGRDGRVEVGDQLTDRDPHDRLVEDHDELGARQGDQGRPVLHRADHILANLPFDRAAPTFGRASLS